MKLAQEYKEYRKKGGNRSLRTFIDFKLVNYILKKQFEFRTGGLNVYKGVTYVDESKPKRDIQKAINAYKLLIERGCPKLTSLENFFGGYELSLKIRDEK